MEFKQAVAKNLGVSILIVGALTVLLLLLGSDIATRAQKVQGQRKELTLRLQSLESLAALRSGADQAGKLLPALQEALPSRDQLIGFSKDLENFAKNNQLGFGFKFGSEISGTENSPGVNTFIITSSGSYGNLIRFLSAVESSKYFVGFSSFDVNQKSQGFEILMNGKVFSQ